jgi:hypothetical protein
MLTRRLTSASQSAKRLREMTVRWSWGRQDQFDLGNSNTMADDEKPEVERRAGSRRTALRRNGERRTPERADDGRREQQRRAKGRRKDEDKPNEDRS